MTPALMAFTAAPIVGGAISPSSRSVACLAIMAAQVPSIRLELSSFNLEHDWHDSQRFSAIMLRGWRSAFAFAAFGWSLSPGCSGSPLRKRWR